jgi:hypothetical protein
MEYVQQETVNVLQAVEMLHPAATIVQSLVQQRK